MNYDMSMMAHCPYNHNHIFEKRKIIYHVKRCKDQKRFNNKQLVYCEFDASDFYFKEEELVHKKRCKYCSNKSIIKNANEKELKSTFPSELFELKDNKSDALQARLDISISLAGGNDSSQYKVDLDNEDYIEKDDRIVISEFNKSTYDF